MNLVWLRNDLRLEDNPALYHAAKQGDTCCVYIISKKQWREHDDAEHKIQLWRQRLIEIAKELQQKNIPLKLLSATHYKHIPKKLLTLAQLLAVEKVFFNKEYPLNEKQRDQHTSLLLEKNGIHTCSYDGDIVLPPDSVTTLKGDVYKVFTPFSKQWHKQAGEQALALLPAPRKKSKACTSSDAIAELWPINNNYRNDLWPVDTTSIKAKLTRFCVHAVSRYKETRDIPSINGTSTLSPYLCAGMISVRQCIASVREHCEEWRSNQWVTELIWREFYRHLINHYPHLSRSENFIATKAPIPWENDGALFQAWCEGRTGFPIVDAAMKQLVRTGWMHNRLRMITAAFLTKLLLIDWRQGEQFFMQHLLDGDYASNNGGWQWAASTGADAAPYFRIFNPLRQSERFDKEGKFIKKLLPELEPLDAKSIHNPSSLQRQQCGYPEPIIDYTFARQRALDGYAQAMGKTKND